MNPEQIQQILDDAVKQGANAAQVREIYTRISQAAPQQPAMKQDTLSQLGAGVLAFGQGAMPIFDEAGAAAGAALEKAGILSPTVQNGGFGEIYDKRLANIRGTEKAFGEEHPYLDPTLRVSGAVAGTLAAPGIAAASAARPVATGAALGGLQGFTGAEGGVGNRLRNSAIGAGLGAGLAYAGKALGDSLAGVNKGQVVQTPQGNVPVPFDASGRALREIKANLALGGVSADDFAQRLAASSADDFAGEVGGENLRMLAQSKGKIPGVAMDAARTAMRQRIEQAPQRVNSLIDSAVASPDDLAQRLAQIEGKGAFEGIFYDRAKEIVPSAPFERIISTPAGQTALKDAAVNLANRTVAPNQIAALQNISKGLETPTAAGTILPELPVGAWHEVAKSLGDQVKRDIAGNIVEPAKAAPVESLRKGMINALRQASPDFNVAQTNSAAMRSSQEALDLGRKLARMATGAQSDDVMQALTASATDLPYARAGYAEGLRDVISAVPYGGNPASRLATPKVLSRTAELVGAGKADDFYKNLMAEKLRMEFANRGLHNSATAETVLQAINNVGDIPLSATEAAKKGGNALLNILSSGNDKRVASMLYATSPAEKAALAAMLTKTQAPKGFGGMKVFTEAERRAMAGLLTQSTPAISAQSGAALYNLGGE